MLTPRVHGGVHPSIEERPADADTSEKTPINASKTLDEKEGDMNTRLFNRRELLGTTAMGIAALATTPALAGFAGDPAADCAVNHVQLSENLFKVLRDPNETEAEKNRAAKTCTCLHCGVHILPADWLA